MGAGREWAVEREKGMWPPVRTLPTGVVGSSGLCAALRSLHPWNHMLYKAPGDGWVATG